METINDKNYELWLLRYAEGDLDAEGRQAVERWLKEHPEAAEELALYNEAPRLERDESVRYVAEVQQHTRPLWSSAWRWAAAAAVALLLLVPLALRLFAPAGEQGLVAAVDEPQPTLTDTVLPYCEPELPSVAKPVLVAAAKPQPAPHDTVLPCLAPEQPAAEEPVLLAEAEPQPATFDTVLLYQEPVQPIEEPAVEQASKLIYVDNLFVEEEPDPFERRLLAANDAAKESLQGFYLGRRLARRMPDDEQLLAYTDNLRERMPQGIRMVTDMVLAYNDSNK